MVSFISFHSTPVTVDCDVLIPMGVVLNQTFDLERIWESECIMGHTIFLEEANETAMRITFISIVNHLFRLHFSLL